MAPLLEQAGHHVVAPDLPGMGDDTTPLADVSLQSWTDFLSELLDAQDEPVVLVGHSRGGLNITAAAEARPGRIKRLVYLCAYLLRDGESIIGVTSENADSQILAKLIPSDDQVSVTLSDETLRELFYNGFSEDDIALALSRVCPEPLAPATTPVSRSDANFGRVPRTYIECLDDKAVPPSLQKQMYEGSPCERVISMPTGHSPFMSAPEELAGHLLELAE